MTRIAISTIVLAIALSVAARADVVFDRPVINSPGTIITVSYNPSSPTYYILGDDFTPTQSGVINDLAVWIVANSNATTNPNQEFSAINLYLGADPGPLTQVATSYTFYAGGTTATTGNPLFKLHFTNLNYTVTAGTPYDFGVEGIPLPGKPQLGLVANACSNLYGPCPGDGADGIYLGYTGTQGSGPFTLSFTEPAAGATSGVADVSVEVGPIPEPSTYLTLCLGLVGLLVLRSRRRKLA